MYGWRGRIGIILTSINGVMEREAFKMMPEGVTCHFTRLMLPSATPEGITEMIENVEHAAKILLTAKVNAIAYAMSIGSFFRGPGGDTELIERMKKVTSLPCTTTSTAIVEALQHLGVNKISAALPYQVEELNKSFRSFFKGNNIEVKEIRGLPFKTSEEIFAAADRQPPHVAYQLAKEADSPDADAIVMSVTNFRTAEIIDLLERDLGKPVVTGVQATIWDILRKINVEEPIKGFGKLLETLG